MPPACKVFRWIRKAGDATVCRRPRLDDDNNSIICPNTTNIDTPTPGHKHKSSFNLPTGEREIWRNKVGEDYSPSSSTISTGKKKHKSLPVPTRKPSTNGGGCSNRKHDVSVDTRRFCMVDPFNLGGHRRSYTVDTWNVTAFYDHDADKRGDDETPATILIAKKENLTRNSRFSIQPIRRNNSNNNNNNKRSIAKEIKEVRTFRWESRRINHEKTISQLYELYEKQRLDAIQNKPLPPVPQNDDQQSIIDDSETMIDPELQSIIDTLSLISDYHSMMESSDDSYEDSIRYTPSTTVRDSFSELLITDEIMVNLLEDEITISSRRGSINSFETLPVDVEMCLSCKRRSTDSVTSVQWCKTCEMKRFEEQFGSWSSGNDDIDCFILESQLNSTSLFDYLEWIPYDRLQDIKLAGTGSHGCTHQAIWLDGPRERWDMKNQRYVRSGECLVALKRFEVAQNLSSDFFDQFSKYLQCENNSGTHIVRCYGITRDPKSEEYMLALQYARDGSLSNYLKQNFADMTWQKRVEILYALAKGLESIHEKNLVHGNLHDGNVLFDDSLTLISDLGMSCHNNDGAYGVLPFIAPELLKNKPYTMASDIYSFGMIMWELITGKMPFADRAHDEKLAMEICKQRSRLEIPEDTPECYAKLLTQCWSFNPFNRPCANMLCETICEWINEISLNPTSEISTQFQQSEEKRIATVNSESEKDDDVHSEAVYTSRSFNFENLYEPNVIFTKSLDPKDHLAIRKHIANETKFYKLKVNSLQAENSDVAAEIFEILQHW